MAENEPFFPTPDIRDENGCGLVQGFPGLTMRDWFAGQALQGLLSTGEDFRDKDGDGWDWHSRAAYAMADAMLEARK